MYDLLALPERQSREQVQKRAEPDDHRSALLTMALYYFDASALAEYDLTEPGNAWYAKSFSCIQIDKLLTMVILFLMDRKLQLTPEDVRHVRRRLRLMQAQLAQRLDISPITVARWESGQRTCQSSFASRIKQLEREHTHRAVRSVTTIFSITHNDLSRLDAQGAVEAFRDLLWCQARRQGVSISSVHITLHEIADGGIDASVDEPALAEFDELLSGHPSYQIKTGSVARPWQDSWLRKELFGSSKAAVDRANLGAAVLRCLENHGRYVLICFGCSPTPEQIAQAREKIKGYFTACGFARPRRLSEN